MSTNVGQQLDQYLNAQSQHIIGHGEKVRALSDRVEAMDRIWGGRCNSIDAALVELRRELRGPVLDGGRYADLTTPWNGTPVHGVDLKEPYESCVGKRIRNFHGSGVKATALCAVIGNQIHNCWVGIEQVSGDALVANNWNVVGCKYGLWAHGDFSHLKSVNNHYWGHERAAWIQGANQFRGIGDSYADAHYGFYGEGVCLKLSDCEFFHCSTAGAVFFGPNGGMDNCDVRVQAVTDWSENGECWGVVFEQWAIRSEIHGGEYTLTGWAHEASKPNGKPAHLIKVAANSCYVNTKLVDAVEVDGSIGLDITGDGCEATVRAFGFHKPKSRIIRCKGKGARLNVSGPLRGDWKKYVEAPADAKVWANGEKVQ